MVVKTTIRAVLAALALGLPACAGHEASSTDESRPTPAPSGYEHHLVRRPGMSVEDQKVYWVDGGRKRWIVDAAWVGAHGYKWPQDVETIPAPALAALPDGEPVR
ncbi:MAG: hypothetical protein QOI11_1851 [Candidatus Eremiobacteraeota bacterium]|nr:hypothetical protein [Candidatus Eremiobacteraeota bacterium]